MILRSLAAPDPILLHAARHNHRIHDCNLFYPVDNSGRSSDRWMLTCSPPYYSPAIRTQFSSRPELLLPTLLGTTAAHAPAASLSPPSTPVSKAARQPCRLRFFVSNRIFSLPTWGINL